MMLLAILMMVGGLALLIFGADWLVRGVSDLALRAGVPNVVVGLTLVAFGTSMPEVVINGISAWQGQSGLAFGNVVGSTAINIGFVLALTALVRPLAVESTMVTREIPLLILAVSVFAALSADGLLDGASQGVLSRSDGVVLLLVFCVFLYMTVRAAFAARRDALVAEVKEEASDARPGSIAKSLLLTVIGMAGVAIGGRLAVSGAVSIATTLGIPEVIVGLTIVSFGTTLPELVTCVAAARRGHADIALGNIVGSNLFNTLFIGGMVATIQPIPIPPGGALDLAAVGVLSMLLLPIALRQRTITRGEGLLLLSTYLAYFVSRLLLVRSI